MKYNKYWFKPKKYGYGVHPCSWEGWLTTLAFILVSVALLGTLNSSTIYLNLILFAIVLVEFVHLSKRKTSGKWGWHWG